MESSFNAVELRELKGGGGRRAASPTSAPSPWTVATVGCSTRGYENASYQQDDELNVDEQPGPDPAVPAASGHHKEQDPELSPHSYDEEEGGRGRDFTELPPTDDRSADYGFIFALVFLVSGIVLVVIAYTIPREAKVNPDSISARQMEKLEMYYAQLGAHLDKCIIAGLGLLTLGGMFLSVLLMVSICRGEMYRRRAAFVRPKRTYGSINMRMKQLATGEVGGDEGGGGVGEEVLVEHAETHNNTQRGPSWDKSEPGPSRKPPAAAASSADARVVN